MKSLTSRLVNLVREEEGLTAVEYGVGLALIAAAVIAAVALVGTNMSDTFTDTGNSANVTVNAEP